VDPGSERATQTAKNSADERRDPRPPTKLQPGTYRTCDRGPSLLRLRAIPILFSSLEYHQFLDVQVTPPQVRFVFSRRSAGGPDIANVRIPSARPRNAVSLYRIVTTQGG